MSRTLLLGLALTIAVPFAAQAQRADLENAAVIQKLYPARALAAGEQGVVGFEVALDKAGHPTSCQVTQSSGFPRLDEETCTVITQHAVFGTNEGVGSRSSTHKGTIAWTLPSGAVASKLAAAVVQAPAKVTCRRFVKSGTIAGYERVCMTPAQWDEARLDSKANFEELQGKGWKQGM
ncbi:TonB family protein [Sphingomonas kaistensis]|uniref:TonB family protein n=1 Tax=Sphingomonas kaistensis TaxID=298708 RepID=A0A7X6BGE1_9SPHN|nr:energy transducer TonB [Sphingomonas kaistensis]NJC04971.1 TonB family protein [Sphingomonas kaistensis]